MQDRIRSKAAWIATIGFILFVLKTYFKIEITDADKVIDMFIAVLTVWGVWNNPTNPEGF